MSSLPIVVVVVLVSLPLYRGFIMEEGHGTLMSNEIGATCEEYRIINCEVSGPGNCESVGHSYFCFIII